ncbi:argininosuccinate synthase [Portibacter lacus]|uniref:argininosuccinate synthase n=1 Tax=Portibacter lacus TaxID=1099794 RepID=A0AA37WD60_9BACT|nr:argininosuccinate synthase domain-containing protein [Portibacter lacus]GLR17546.1 argininosuccinate synthase [Portibacter lacus]
MKKVVLAYSGGLDTSFCIPYLTLEKDCEVHCFSVNTGGFSDEELEAMESRAMQLGAASFEAVNIEEAFYEKCIKYLIYGNVLRNDTYPLSVSAERVFQAVEVAKYAKEMKADAIAHGSTGAGNDQVRFDLIFSSITPECEIITPIRDNGFARAYEIEYLNKVGLEWSAAKGTYSINQGLWGTSIGGKETLNSRHAIPSEAYPSQLKETDQTSISIGFEEGTLVSLNGEKLAPIQVIKKLNDLAADYAIGRDIHVGDTIIGIKGRVAFEAAAPMIIIKAHQLLEKHTLSKWQSYWKKQLSEWYGMFVHEGQYLEPVMRNIETFLEDTQDKVNGEVFIKLFPHRFELEGIDSPNDLMDVPFGKYGEEQGAWTADDAKGFIKILGNASKIYYHKNKEDQL